MIDSRSALPHDFASWTGRTPLVELRRSSPKPGVRLFAKLEVSGPTGSIKDRVALALIRAAEQSGKLKPGGTIVEASSGNTAIALGSIGRALGYEVRVVLPRGCVPTIADALALLGVEVTVCVSRAGMHGAIEAANELADRIGGVAVGQFTSQANVDVHYSETAGELLEALPRIDAFVAGIGTAGTIMGVGRRLREANPAVRLVGVEPKMGERLQGLTSIEEGFSPPLLDLDLLDRRLLVDAATSLLACRTLAAREGLLAGVSSGACLHAALREVERLEQGNVVFMCSDGGCKYLPTRPWDAAATHDEGLDEVHWW